MDQHTGVNGGQGIFSSVMNTEIPSLSSIRSLKCLSLFDNLEYLHDALYCAPLPPNDVILAREKHRCAMEVMGAEIAQLSWSLILFQMKPSDLGNPKPCSRDWKGKEYSFLETESLSAETLETELAVLKWANVASQAAVNMGFKEYLSEMIPGFGAKLPMEQNKLLAAYFHATIGALYLDKGDVSLITEILREALLQRLTDERELRLSRVHGLSAGYASDKQSSEMNESRLQQQNASLRSPSDNIESSQPAAETLHVEVLRSFPSETKPDNGLEKQASANASQGDLRTESSNQEIKPDFGMKDCKNKLKEYCRRVLNLVPVLEEETIADGPANIRFKAKVVVNGNTVAEYSDTSKKKAERAAFSIALQKSSKDGLKWRFPPPESRHDDELVSGGQKRKSEAHRSSYEPEPVELGESKKRTKAV